MMYADASSRAASGARGPLVVELVGLPGAGKTTIAQAAIEELETFGYLVASRRTLGNRGRREALRSVMHRARNPRILWGALRSALATAPLTTARVRHALRLADWAYRLTMPRASRYDVIVLDQGVVQEGWSVAIGSARPAIAHIASAIRTVVDRGAPRFALVRVELTPDAACRRLAKRASGGSRFDAVKPTEAKRLLEAAAPSLATIVSATARGGSLPQLRLDARRPVEHTTAELVAFVRSLLAPSALFPMMPESEVLDFVPAAQRHAAPEVAR